MKAQKVVTRSETYASMARVIKPPVIKKTKYNRDSELPSMWFPRFATILLTPILK